MEENSYGTSDYPYIADLSLDVLLEIIEKMDYEKIKDLCLTYSGFVDLCKHPYVQTILNKKENPLLRLVRLFLRNLGIGDCYLEILTLLGIL